MELRQFFILFFSSVVIMFFAFVIIFSFFYLGDADGGLTGNVVLGDSPTIGEFKWDGEATGVLLTYNADAEGEKYYFIVKGLDVSVISSISPESAKGLTASLIEGTFSSNEFSIIFAHNGLEVNGVYLDESVEEGLVYHYAFVVCTKNLDCSVRYLTNVEFYEGASGDSEVENEIESNSGAISPQGPLAAGGSETEDGEDETEENSGSDEGGTNPGSNSSQGGSETEDGIASTVVIH